MPIKPILSALTRSKTGAALVVLQIALSMALVSNLLSIVQTRVERISRPTGIAQHELFAQGLRLNQGIEDAAAREADLAKIRSLPSVMDAVATNAYPLRGNGWREGIGLTPQQTDEQHQRALISIYAMDEHALGTFGMQLIDGRNFKPEEGVEGQTNSSDLAAVAIITQTLARHLFADDAAVGQQVYLSAGPHKPITIIGVVRALQTPQALYSNEALDGQASLIMPLRTSGQGALLVIRSAPGQRERATQAVRAALLERNPARQLGASRSFDEVRDIAYQKDHAIVIALLVLGAVLVIVTVTGIVGLTSFWVARRQRQIGIRRALGASARAIVEYFLLENALLCLLGVVLGGAAGVLVNAWLISRYGVQPIPALAWLVCALLMLALGQAAAIFPARRAARVPPIQAVRAL